MAFTRRGCDACAYFSASSQHQLENVVPVSEWWMINLNLENFIPGETKSLERCLFSRVGERKKPKRPFGLLEISVLIFLVGFITFFAIQTQTLKPRSGTSPANACINNLRQIDAGTIEFDWKITRLTAKQSTFRTT